MNRFSRTIQKTIVVVNIRLVQKICLPTIVHAFLINLVELLPTPHLNSPPELPTDFHSSPTYTPSNSHLYPKPPSTLFIGSEKMANIFLSRQWLRQQNLKLGKSICVLSVSYTHLTLPTICSV